MSERTSAAPPGADPSSRFPATYRLVLYCVLVGLLGAAAALLFDGAVELAQSLLLRRLGRVVLPGPGRLPAAPWIHVFAVAWFAPLATVVGGLLSGLLVFTFAPEAEGHGTDAAIETYHQKGGDVRPRVPFLKGVASALTIGSGGVAGREGPTAQIAVGLGAIFSRLLRLRGEERRILLLASMAAGLAAVFRAPLGMAIFAVEILYSGMVFESEALIYTVISAVTAYAAHGFFVGWAPIFAIPAGLTFESPLALAGFALLGAAAGVFGAVLPALFYGARDFFRRLRVPRHVQPAIGGLLVGAAGMFLPELLGTGYGFVEYAVAGKMSLVLMAVLLGAKALGMSVTIGSGGSGGVFGPTVTMGALLGAIVGGLLAKFGPALGAPPSSFAVVGMACIFAGAARAPISTLIMVAEMTGGYGLIVPAMLANIAAFLVQRSLTHGSRYPTLYQAQVETREDSPAHRGLFVRRALSLLERGGIEPSEIELPRLVTLLRFGHPIPVTSGDGLLVAVRAARASKLDGATVGATIGALPGTTAVAILRGEAMIVPRGPTELAAGDQIVAIATSEGYALLKDLACDVAAAKP